MITVFTETEQGNYVSVGSKGKTFVAKSDKGWIHGLIPLDAVEFPTDGQVYLTPQEALRAASAVNGYKIEGRDTREIGIALYS